MPYIPTIRLGGADCRSSAGSAAVGSTGGAAAAFVADGNCNRGFNKTPQKIPKSLESSLARVPSTARLVKQIAAANAVAAATAAEYPEVPTAMRAALAFCKPFTIKYLQTKISFYPLAFLLHPYMLMQHKQRLYCKCTMLPYVTLSKYFPTPIRTTNTKRINDYPPPYSHSFPFPHSPHFFLKTILQK